MRRRFYVFDSGYIVYARQWSIDSLYSAQLFAFRGSFVLLVGVDQQYLLTYINAMFSYKNAAYITLIDDKKKDFQI